MVVVLAGDFQFMDKTLRCHHEDQHRCEDRCWRGLRPPRRRHPVFAEVQNFGFSFTAVSGSLPARSEGDPGTDLTGRYGFLSIFSERLHAYEGMDGAPSSSTSCSETVA